MALTKINKTHLLVALAVTLSSSTIYLYSENNELKDDSTSLNKNIKELKLKNEDLNSRNTSAEQSLKEEKDKNIELENNNKGLEEKNIELRNEVKSLNTKLNSYYPTSKDTSNKSVSRSSSTRGTAITMKLSFYGDGAEENGGYAGIDAQGNKLIAGTVASNVYPPGTQFSYNGQIYTVRDKGGSHFNSYDRLDVFVPRNSGESKSDYKKRISNYGRKTVTMYKL